MYHTRKAKERHDKVYALLGMSSDDITVAGLSVDYEVSWRKLFQQLIHFILSERVSVDTWDDKEIAIIKGKGCILGEVSSVERDTAWEDRQHVGITWKNELSYIGMKETWGISRAKGAWSSRWTFQTSAKSVQVGDAICLLQGASRPTIIRLYTDYCAVIMIAVPPEDDLRTTTRYIKWSKLLQSITAFPHDFLLVWDWEHPDKSQDGEDYGYFMSSRVPKCSKTELEDCLDEATRLQNARLVLQEIKKYEMVLRNLQKATKAFERALRSMNNLGFADRGYSRWEEGDAKKLEVLVDLVIKDKGQWTLLCLAAGKGHEAVVKLLLDTGKIDSNAEDLQTALRLASWNGHEVVVTLLLDSGKVDPNARDWDGSTALRSAAGNGHEGVVKLLLDSGKVGSHTEDLQTALQSAARNGHEAVVKLLLDNNKVDPNARNWDDSTALLSAAENGHEAVVKLLLDSNNVKPNGWSRGGCTALHLAARNGHSAVIKLLLDNNNVDPNTSDWCGWTVLHMAAGNGCKAVVKLLLDNGKVDFNAKNGDRWTALLLAAKYGHEAVVKLLIDSGKADLKIHNDEVIVISCGTQQSRGLHPLRPLVSPVNRAQRRSTRRDRGILGRFLYTGAYTGFASAETDGSAVISNVSASRMYWPNALQINLNPEKMALERVSMGHAKIWVFARRFAITSLMDLAYSQLAVELAEWTILPFTFTPVILTPTSHSANLSLMERIY
ncbi:hypothetical protein DL767_002261 [Monosporascus sp. MG133]|nr:hypothetical protein DL767_002261 [Monosporascus sp. MG133]